MKRISQMLPPPPLLDGEVDGAPAGGGDAEPDVRVRSLGAGGCQ
jgi:hypothetical protein